LAPDLWAIRCAGANLVFTVNYINPNAWLCPIAPNETAAEKKWDARNMNITSSPKNRSNRRAEVADLT